MKVGDLVKNGQGQTGVVTGVGRNGWYESYGEAPQLNPDIHVVTVGGKRLWSFKTLEVISEGR